MANSSDIIQVIKEAAVNAVEETQPAKFVFGIVVMERPLKIKIHERLIIPAEFLTLTRNVTDHVLKVTLNSGSVQTMQVKNALKYNEKVVMIKNKGANGYLVVDRVVRAK